MGRRTSSRRAVVPVPGAYGALLANAEKMLPFCICPGPGRCGPHARFDALRAGEPITTHPGAFSWALSVPASLADLGDTVTVYPDDLVEAARVS